MTTPNVKEAINQVRGYCDDSGIRYAVATNGYAWIAFRAIREDMPWREGSARIFPSLEDVESNFTEFWNLLSYEAIQAGSLDSEFGTSLTPHRSSSFRTSDENEKSLATKVKAKRDWNRFTPTGLGVEKLSANWLIFMKSIWRCGVFSGVV